jgi:peptidoglycan/LPS O-acetylase OafA/YrhL
MTNKKKPSNQNRIYFLDNLKAFVIFLVVLNHAGYVYDKSGILSSVWIVDDPSKNALPGILNLIVDMFMMPIIFFISGYFTPLSLKTKTGWCFVISRFKKLMVPWVIAVLTLIPLYKVIFLYARNLPQENLASYFHFSGGILINQGWLWFLPVLFMFDLLYYGLLKLKLLTLNFNLKWTVMTVFLVGFLYSVCMSFLNTYGWTKTLLLDFQNERLLIYFMIFLLGSLCFKLDVFKTLPTSKKLYIFICATCWLPMNVYIIFLVNLFLNPGIYIISYIFDIILVWIGFHLSLFSLLYILINTFRFYLNRSGRILRSLGKYSYGVYIIHFIVLGCIALFLLNTTISSLSKYAILTVSTYLISILVVSLYYKIVQVIRK